MTGITRISRESVFSDLNNLTVVTTTFDLYVDCFGFSRQEVWNALDKYDLSDTKDKVKKFASYWANTSSNSLIGKLIREGSAIWSLLLAGGYLRVMHFNTDSKDQAAYELILTDVLDAMNTYMNRVAVATFSSFGTGKHPLGESDSECFYHDFVLGLIVELEDRYRITSNREMNTLISHMKFGKHRNIYFLTMIPLHK